MNPAAHVATSTETRKAETDQQLPRALVGVGFLVLALSYMINAMDRQVFPPLLPSIREAYGFSLQQGGLLATGFTLGMALAGLPAGYLVDRFPRKTVLLVSIVIYSVGTMVTPLASGFADMSVYRVLSGFGEGMQSAALFAAVGAYFNHRRGLAFGVLGVAYSTGVFFSPLVGVQLMNVYGTWGAPFYVFGAAGLVIALLAALVVRPALTERTVDKVVSTKTYDYMPASPYNRNTIALALHAVVGGVVLYGFLGLYPTFLISTLRFTPAQAALAMSFLGFGGLLALVGGWLGDRVNQRNLLIVSQVACSVLSLLIYQLQGGIGWQCVLAFLMGVFGLGVLFPNTNSAMQRAVRPEQVGRGAGIFVTSYYGTAAFSGLLFAALVEAFGWRGAGLLQLTLLPVAGIAALTFVRTSRFNNAVR